MSSKRYRTALLVLTAVLLVVINLVTVPLFLYAAFGSDATLDYSGLGWLMNVLLSAWVFFLVPNFPLLGMMASVLQRNKRRLYIHIGCFMGIIIGGLLFFLAEEGIAWLLALIITQACGIASLILLWTQFTNRKGTTPANKKV